MSEARGSGSRSAVVPPTAYMVTAEKGGAPPPSITASQAAALERVNIFEDPRVFAVLDEGCNRTCHGSRWMKNAQIKFAKLGRTLGPLKGEPKTYSGLGTTETAGRRVIPWGTFLSNGEHIGGALTSNEMKGSRNLPLLFSLAAQATLVGRTQS